VAERLDALLAVLAVDPRVAGEPQSRLLAARLRRAAAGSERPPADDQASR